MIIALALIYDFQSLRVFEKRSQNQTHLMLLSSKYEHESVFSVGRGAGMLLPTS